jgi:hypothetical protein
MSRRRCCCECFTFVDDFCGGLEHWTILTGEWYASECWAREPANAESMLVMTRRQELPWMAGEVTVDDPQTTLNASVLLAVIDDENYYEFRYTRQSSTACKLELIHVVDGTEAVLAECIPPICDVTSIYACIWPQENDPDTTVAWFHGAVRSQYHEQRIIIGIERPAVSEEGYTAGFRHGNAFLSSFTDWRFHEWALDPTNCLCGFCLCTDTIGPPEEDPAARVIPPRLMATIINAQSPCDNLNGLSAVVQQKQCGDDTWLGVFREGCLAPVEGLAQLTPEIWGCTVNRIGTQDVGAFISFLCQTYQEEIPSMFPEVPMSVVLQADSGITRPTLQDPVTGEFLTMDWHIIPTDFDGELVLEPVEFHCYPFYARYEIKAIYKVNENTRWRECYPCGERGLGCSPDQDVIFEIVLTEALPAIAAMFSRAEPDVTTRHDLSEYPRLQSLVESRPAYRKMWTEGRFPYGAGTNRMPLVRTTPEERAHNLLAVIATQLVRIEERRSRDSARRAKGITRHVIPATRPIDEIQAIVDTHCTTCTMFDHRGCQALTGCSKTTEYHALLTSPSGRCPQKRW